MPPMTTVSVRVLCFFPQVHTRYLVLDDPLAYKHVRSWETTTGGGQNTTHIYDMHNMQSHMCQRIAHLSTTFSPPWDTGNTIPLLG